MSALTSVPSSPALGGAEGVDEATHLSCRAVLCCLSQNSHSSPLFLLLCRYFLKHILHDWDDESSVKVSKKSKCRTVTPCAPALHSAFAAATPLRASAPQAAPPASKAAIRQRSHTGPPNCCYYGIAGGKKCGTEHSPPPPVKCLQHLPPSLPTDSEDAAQGSPPDRSPAAV